MARFARNDRARNLPRRLAGALRSSTKFYAELPEDGSAVWQALTVAAVIGAVISFGASIGFGLYSHSNMPPYNAAPYNGIVGIQITDTKIRAFVQGLLGMTAASVGLWFLLSLLIWVFGNTSSGADAKGATFRQLLQATGFSQAPRFWNFFAFLSFLGETPLLYLGVLLYIGTSVWFLFTTLAAVRSVLPLSDPVVKIVSIGGWFAYMIISTGLYFFFGISLYLAGFSGTF